MRLSIPRSTLPTVPPVVPTGSLSDLRTNQIAPSQNNPRYLFDPEPLRELRESIRTHGVLVPITVYLPKGQSKYFILDGERRYRCCVELEKEGVSKTIPANIVEPPNNAARLIYMFSIHSLRQGWELMPTALSLKTLLDEIGETDDAELS